MDQRTKEKKPSKQANAETHEVMGELGEYVWYSIWEDRIIITEPDTMMHVLATVGVSCGILEPLGYL